MAIAFAFVKLAQLNQAAADAGKPSLSEALTVTGANVMVLDRPVVDGQPGDAVEVQSPKLWGGYSIIGSQGQWSAMLLSSLASRINNVDTKAQAYGNLFILLALGTKNGGGYNWDVLLDQADIDFINTKIEVANLPIDPISPTETARHAVKRLYGYFDPTFEIEQWGLEDNE